MRLVAIAGCLTLLAAAPAVARLTHIEVKAVEPFAPGTTFGAAGAYERVKGVFRGELDPGDPRNRVIVNLDKAPRNANGKVDYEADFFMLRPADPARANGKIIYDVTNRGRLNFHWRFTGSEEAIQRSAYGGGCRRWPVLPRWLHVRMERLGPRRTHAGQRPRDETGCGDECRQCDR